YFAYGVAKLHVEVLQRPHQCTSAESHYPQLDVHESDYKPLKEVALSLQRKSGMLLISDGVCEYQIVRTESRNVKMVIKRKISFKMLKEKIEDENSRYWEAEATYLELLKDMEHQKIELDNVVAAYLKEKIAFDYKKIVTFSPQG
ncbi:hypothetical protein Tco_1331682, partial [Tanacetum coccineum]